MTAASLLTEALGLIEDPASFTADGIVLDRHGREVNTDSKNAAQFSVVGALLRATKETEDLSKVATILRKLTGPKGMFEFEEQHGHSEVIKLMRRAIVVAEREAA